MILRTTTEPFLRGCIKRLEENIEIVEHSNFSEKEKLELKKSYLRQIAKHKQKLVSFYPGRKR